MIIALGWKFVPIVLLDSTLMVVVACLFNNLLRQYPLYWWTPASTGRQLRKERAVEMQGYEEQGGKAAMKPISDTSRYVFQTSYVISRTNSGVFLSDRTLRREFSNHVDFIDGIEDIHVRAYRIELPRHLELDDAEIMLLEKIQERVRMHGEIENP